MRSAGLLTVSGDLRHLAVDMGLDGWELPMDIGDFLNQDDDTGEDDDTGDDALDTCVVLASACHDGDGI